MNQQTLNRVVESVVATFRRHKLTHAEIALVLRTLVDGHMEQLARMNRRQQLLDHANSLIARTK